MGQANSKDSTIDAETAAYQKYLQEMEAVNAITNSDQHRGEELLNKAKELEEELENRDQRLKEERQKEYEQQTEHTTQLSLNKERLYSYAARIICLCFYNYGIGWEYTNESIEKTNQILTECLSPDVFWLLTKIPIMQLIIWPTGIGDEDFHNYESVKNDQGSIDIERYYKHVNDLIPAYLKASLNYTIKYLVHYNIPVDNVLDNDQIVLDNKQCEEYINSVSKYSDDLEFVTGTIGWLHKMSIYTDLYAWRMLRGKAYKNACRVPIEILPSNYPLTNPLFELKDALMMLMNTLFSVYGRCLNESHEQATSLSQIVSKGGRCFAPNIEMLKMIQQLGLISKDIYTINTKMWTGLTYINISEASLDTSFDNPTYKPHEKIINVNGKMKYENPTQKYTRHLLTDYEGATLLFDYYLSGINCNNTSNLVKFVTEELLTQPKYSRFNVFSYENNPNYKLMHASEFIIFRPINLKGTTAFDEKIISPLCEYVYQKVIKETAQWKITFPINNIMSCSQLNYRLEQETGNIKYSPLYMFTRTKLINENESRGSESNENIDPNDVYRPTFNIFKYDSTTLCRTIDISETNPDIQSIIKYPGNTLWNTY